MAYSTPDKQEQTQEQRLFDTYIQKEQESVQKTQKLLANKLRLRQLERKKRIRSIYKLTRGSFPRIWFEPAERERATRWLGLARRIALRDRKEIQLLHEEIDIATSAKEKLDLLSERLVSQQPKARSLHRPLEKKKIVGKYGIYQGSSRKVKLQRRGVLLESKSGDVISTVAPGIVRYVGAISGIGMAMIIDHGGFLSIIGHLSALKVTRGQVLETKAPIALAIGKSVYLEIRIKVGDLGIIINPTQLIR